MPAQLRIALTDEQADHLDSLRGAATRTAYATALMRQALEPDTAPALTAGDIRSAVRAELEAAGLTQQPDAATPLGDSVTPPARTAPKRTRERCPHRATDRYCKPCGAAIDADGYVQA